MITAYHCEFCGKTYYSPDECLEHEKSHIESLTGKEKVLYEYRNQDKNHFDYNYVCHCCDNGYYVYGCELDCKYWGTCNQRNGWTCFAPKTDK